MIITMAPLIKGIFTALIMTVGVGPGMLLNFHTSLRKGFVSGLAVVAGLYASDGIFLAVNYFGVFHVIKSFQHQKLTGIVCGAVLCAVGIGMLVKKQSEIFVAKETCKIPERGNFIKGFASGFMVNITNPFVFTFWMTLMSIATLNFGFKTNPFHVYFATVVATALLLDIIKSYLFSRFKTGLKAKIMARINHGMGAILACTGIVLICRSIVVFS